LNTQSAHIEIFKAISANNEKAFEQLYTLYFPRLYTFVSKFVKDSYLAKDIVQNSFIKLWETRQTFNYRNPEAFLFQIVRNASLNYIRHLKVIETLDTKIKEKYLGEELYYIDMVSDEPYILIAEELQNKVIEIMDSLPEKCREVFRLSRIDGLKNQEIANLLGISLKAVEKHISKALAVYRSHFSDYLPLPIILLIIQNLK
jgi:RNA polymerase sigma-70 factor (ECF subfamily)